MGIPHDARTRTPDRWAYRLVRFAYAAVMLSAILVAGYPHTSPAQPKAAGHDQPMTPSLELSSDEIAWRNQHPVVTVGVFDGDHQPMEAWLGGHPEGMGVDYIRLLAERAGLQLEFKPFSDWKKTSFPGPNDHLAMEVLLGQFTQPVPEDHRYTFLSPYAVSTFVMVTRRGDIHVRTEEDLKHARLVLERRFRITREFIESQWPDATLVYAQDGQDALNTLAKGEADAYIGITAFRTQALLRRRQTNDLVMLTALSNPAVPLSLAVRSSEPALIGILRKAEATITSDELRHLRQRWGMQPGESSSSRPTAILNPHEHKWLDSLPVLRLGYETDRRPYTFTGRNGDMEGLAADYVDYLKKELGLEVELVPASDWLHLRQMVQAHEIDMVATAMPKDFNNSDMMFSRPYERFPAVIVAKHGSPISGPASLAGRRVGLRDEPGLTARLQQLMGKSTLVPVASINEGLALLQEGKIDAFVGTLPALDALLRERYAATLRVVGPTGIDQDFAIGVRSEYGDLIPLIDRILVNMRESDRQRIRSQWLTVQYNYGAPWGWVLGGILLSLLTVSAVMLAYRRLRRGSLDLARMQQELSGQLEFQRALLETIPYPVFVLDDQDRYLAVNSAYESMSNIRREDIEQKTRDQIFHELPGNLKRMTPSSIKALKDAQAKTLAADDSYRKELRIEYIDGSVAQDLILWRRSFTHACASNRWMLCTLVDVSDIRAAEARARASEQRLADIAATLPIAVFQVQVWPGKRHDFTYVNGNVLSTIGVSAEEILNDASSISSRVHPDDMMDVLRRMDLAARSDNPVPPFDFRLTGYNGNVGWVRTAGGRPHRLPDGSAQWSGYWLDTTELHEQSIALDKAKSQAESAAAAKNTFLAMMSHEIRTPMAGVIGLTELLGKTPLGEDQQHMLGMISESARALLDILDDILDYSRADSGHLEIESKSTNLRQLVDNVLGLMALKAKDKGLRLYAPADWRLAKEHIADETRLRQILINLISNAIKFTESGYVEIAIDVVGDIVGIQRMRITVTDTGIGMTEDQLARVFDPFTQAEASTTRIYGGTGLGLAICRKLAEIMHADLSMRSVAGQGTSATLEIALPVMERLRPDPQLTGRVAAVYEDDPHIRKEVSSALSALGFNVIACDASDADEHEPDDAELVVAHPAMMQRMRISPSTQLIKLTDADTPHAIAGPGRAITLSINPLMWREIQAACKAAFGMPADIAEQAQLPADTVLHPSRAGFTILVAEDHAINRILIGRQLDQLGYRYEAFNDGEQALEAYRKGNYSALITDCHMPRMDGFSLAQRIREGEAGDHHLPIIGLSASVQVEQIQRCKNAGMDGFLSKPTSIVELDENLRRLLPAATPELPDTVALPVPSTAATKNGDALEVLMAAFGDRNVVSNILAEYTIDARLELTRIEALFSTGDNDTLDQQLHKFQGGLRLVGNRELSDHIEDMRHDIRAEDMEEALRMWQQIRADIVAFVANLEQVQADLEAGHDG